VSSPLCVYELGLVCSQTQLCHIGLFVDFVEQLHVSAFVGHHQVVLREIRLHTKPSSHFSHVYFNLLFFHFFLISVNVLPYSVFKAEYVAEILSVL